MARFYSGGIDNFYEHANLGQYADGKSEALAAFVLNIEDTAINIANAALSLLDADAATNIVTCAVLKGTMDQSVASATQTSGTVSGGMRLVTSTVKSILAEVPGCDTSEIASEGVDGAIALLALAVPEVGVPIEGALDALQGTSDVAEAVQRLGEMAFSASPVETAVIAIQPGAPLPYNPAPSISALSPASAAVGGASQDVTIQGANLQSNSVVAINGTTHSSTLGTDGSLQITLTSSDLQQTADLLVTVTNPLPGGGTAEALFPVGSPTAPTPTITSLYPAAAVQNTPTSPVCIVGSGFLPNATVTFNGNQRKTTAPSDTGQITMILQPADLSGTGSFPIMVQNPGNGPASTAYNFDVIPSLPPQPSVLSVMTNKRIYVAGDLFWLTYSVLPGVASGPLDLDITFQSITSGNIYYHYYNGSDSNSVWIHSTPGSLLYGTVQAAGTFNSPPAGTVFTITDSVPSGSYHIRAFYAQHNSQTPVGQVAETDYSVATSTAPGGCFIATAAFGSDMTGQVQLLRLFRDRLLLPRSWGRSFVNWYYSWSPGAAAWLRGRPLVRKLTRAALILPIAFAWLSLRIGMLAALLLLLLCIAGIYQSLKRGSRLVRALSLALLIVVVVCV
jgi:hypothetical protein